MSAPKNIDDVLLHRFFDGDLTEQEAAEVQAALDAEPSLADKIAGLEEIRLAVRASAARSVEGLASDDLWARVEAGLVTQSSAPARPAKPALRAIPGGASKRPLVNRAGLAEPKVLPLLVGALAIAAVALLAIWAVPGGSVGPGADGVQLAEVQDASGGGLPSQPEPAHEEAVIARTEIVEVDFGPNSGTIFAVEGDQEGERFAVVWLADIMPKQSPPK